MEHILVADHVQAEEALQLETTKGGRGAAVDFTDANDAIMLRGAGIGAEIDVVVDGRVFHTGMQELVLPVKVHGQIGGGMEVVFPTEVVGIVFRFKPGGGLAFQVDIKS